MKSCYSTTTTVESFLTGVCFHLEGPEAELEHQTLPLADVLWREGEHSVVDPEERDQQQRGAGQPPTKQHVPRTRVCTDSPVRNDLVWSRVKKVWMSNKKLSQVNAGFVTTDIWGLELLDQDDDDSDEEHEVDLQT